MGKVFEGNPSEVLEFILQETKCEVKRRKIIRSKLERLEKEASGKLKCVKINDYHFIVQVEGSNSLIDLIAARFVGDTSKTLLHAKFQHGKWKFQ